jgi:hypothetical protein
MYKADVQPAPQLFPDFQEAMVLPEMQFWLHDRTVHSPIPESDSAGRGLNTVLKAPRLLPKFNRENKGARSGDAPVNPSYSGGGGRKMVV